MLNKVKLLSLTVGLLLFMFPMGTQAQENLEDVLPGMFSKFLGSKSSGGLLVPVPNPNGMNMDDSHDQHFRTASEVTSVRLSNALQSLITGNISSFPLSSTSSGSTFEFSEDGPVRVSESLGPIFAERGTTLGKNKLNLGLNYTYLDFQSFRGTKLEDMTFVFSHLSSNSLLGDNPNESDLIRIRSDLNINASLATVFATYGLGENFDIGVAVPIVNINMEGNAVAEISSFTFPLTGQPNHHFGTLENPTLIDSVAYDGSASGIGDITVRLKYSFSKGSGLQFAALLDTRLPTGKVEDYLGTGRTSFRFMGILSQKFDDFTPHLNVGYDYRAGDADEFDSDEIEFALGFDQKIGSDLTLAIDLLGEINVESEEAVELFETRFIEIQDQHHSVSNPLDPQGDPIPARSGLKFNRKIENGNIPFTSPDNQFNLAVGFRYSPSPKMIILLNALVALNDSGLRSNVIPTGGISFSL